MDPESPSSSSSSFSPWPWWPAWSGSSPGSCGGVRRQAQTTRSWTRPRLIQELYQGLNRMEQRVEALETLLPGSGRKGRPTMRRFGRNWGCGPGGRRSGRGDPLFPVHPARTVYRSRAGRDHGRVQGVRDGALRRVRVRAPGHGRGASVHHRHLAPGLHLPAGRAAHEARARRGPRATPRRPRSTIPTCPRGPRASARLKRKFEGLDKRIRRMEGRPSPARDYEWEDRFNS